MENIAVYAGSFDPVTLGHTWVIEQGTRLFDKLIVAVGINPEKHSNFPIDERIALLKEATSECGNIEVTHYSNKFLIKYAEEVGARYILRGIRNPTDYEYEKTWRYVNSDLNPSITTVFLIPPRDIAEISSSVIRGLVGPTGWEDVVRKYVPECVLIQLKKMHESGRF